MYTIKSVDSIESLKNHNIDITQRILCADVQYNVKNIVYDAYLIIENRISSMDFREFRTLMGDILKAFNKDKSYSRVRIGAKQRFLYESDLVSFLEYPKTALMILCSEENHDTQKQENE